MPLHLPHLRRPTVFGIPVRLPSGTRILRKIRHRLHRPSSTGSVLSEMSEDSYYIDGWHSLPRRAAIRMHYAAYKYVGVGAHYLSKAFGGPGRDGPRGRAWGGEAGWESD